MNVSRLAIIVALVMVGLVGWRYAVQEIKLGEKSSCEKVADTQNVKQTHAQDGAKEFTVLAIPEVATTYSTKMLYTPGARFEITVTKNNCFVDLVRIDRYTVNTTRITVVPSKMFLEKVTANTLTADDFEFRLYGSYETSITNELVRVCDMTFIVHHKSVAITQVL